jgi:hypothetical protein
MPSINSQVVTVTVTSELGHFKVFKVVFQRNDGSLSVAFPYYRDAQGLLCHARVKAGTQYPNKLDLTESGTFTSHRVKYSHHASGLALFSQDGKIYSRVRKDSVRLDSANGHLFTVQLQGLTDYDEIAPDGGPPPNTPKKARLDFRFAGKAVEAIKFWGACYSESKLRNLIAAGTIWVHPTEPVILMNRPVGAKITGAIIHNPYLQSTEDFFLLLLCEPIPRLDSGKESALIFLGGFDPPEIAFDRSKELSFLALSYPTDSYDRLVSKIGTVDYAPVHAATM